MVVAGARGRAEVQEVLAVLGDAHCVEQAVGFLKSAVEEGAECGERGYQEVGKPWNVKYGDVQVALQSLGGHRDAP